MTNFCENGDEPCGKYFSCLSPTVMTLMEAVHSSKCDVV